MSPDLEPRDPAHPRPHLQRAGWRLLDGTWEFALDPAAEHTHPRQVDFASTIVVPFAPETPASGVAYGGFLRRCWYRTTVEVERPPAGERVLVHFGAVDRIAHVWANGHLVGQHTGGYTPFAVDVTDVLGETNPLELVVRADDEPRNLAIPRGKQDWEAEPHAIWYPRTTGIWQSVWLEVVPPLHIEQVTWTGDHLSLDYELVATIVGEPAEDQPLRVTLQVGETTLTDETITVSTVVDGRAQVRHVFELAASVWSVDDVLWSPEHPALIEARLELGTDIVRSYGSVRGIEVIKGGLYLNGQPLTLRFALDQGYWADGGMTAPSLGALRRDVELVRELGLNGVRKHQKIEDPRWLAFCDELGVLVWEELPSTYPFSTRGAAALMREWIDVIERDRNHPCIIAWVPINESWGVPDAVNQTQQRALIEALASLTRALDPTRLISANDGWQTVGGDIVGIHDYDQDARKIGSRYARQADLNRLFHGAGPAGAALTLDGSGPAGRALVLSEFGGTTLAESAEGLHGYGNVTTDDAWVARVGELCRAVLSSKVLSGYCWTQLTDTYQEANGLLHMDRTPKAPLDQLRPALEGRVSGR